MTYGTRLLIGLAFGSLLLTACFRLPNENREEVIIDPGGSTEEELRELTTFANLGVCTEDGWSGSIVSEASSPLEGTISVTFIGLGDLRLGTGTTTVTIEPGASTDFLVVPDPTLDDFALSCTIELAEISVIALN